MEKHPVGSTILAFLVNAGAMNVLFPLQMYQKIPVFIGPAALLTSSCIGAFFCRTFSVFIWPRVFRMPGMTIYGGWMSVTLPRLRWDELYGDVKGDPDDNTSKGGAIYVVPHTKCP